MATGDRHRPRPLHLRAPTSEPFTLAQNIAVQCLSPTLPRDLPPDLLQRTRELEADQRRIIADRHQAGLKGQPTEETQRAADVKPHQIVYHTPRRTHFGDDYEAPLSASEGHRPKPKADPDAPAGRPKTRDAGKESANKGADDDDDDDDDEDDDDDDADDDADDDDAATATDAAAAAAATTAATNGTSASTTTTGTGTGTTPVITTTDADAAITTTNADAGSPGDGAAADSAAPSLTDDESVQPEVAAERLPTKNIHVPRPIVVPALPPDKPSSAPGSPSAAASEGHQRPLQQAPHSAPPYPVPQQGPFHSQRLPSVHPSPDNARPGSGYSSRALHPYQQQYAGAYGNYSQPRGVSYHSHSHSQGHIRAPPSQHSQLGGHQDPHTVHAQARLKQQQYQQQQQHQSRAHQQARQAQHQAYASQHYGNSINQAYAGHPRQRGLQQPGYRYNSYTPSSSGMQWQMHGMQRQLDELQHMQRTVLEAVLQQYQVMSVSAGAASAATGTRAKTVPNGEAAPLQQLAEAAAAQLAQLAPRLQSQLDYLVANGQTSEAQAVAAAAAAGPGQDAGDDVDEDRALDTHYRLQTAAGERAKGRRTAAEELRNATIIPSPRLQMPVSAGGPLPEAPEPQPLANAPENDPRRTTLAARRGGRVMTLNVTALNPPPAPEPLSARLGPSPQPSSPHSGSDGRRRSEDDSEVSADRKRRKTGHAGEQADSANSAERSEQTGRSEAAGAGDVPTAGSSPVLVEPLKPAFPAGLAAALPAALPAGLSDDRRGRFLSLCEQIYELFDSR